MSKHILNEKFDKIVCINLINRKDKKEKMQARFDKLGIEVEWFTAVSYGFAPSIVRDINKGSGHFNENQPNEFGAALSHYTVIKQALEEGHKSIFVFEDDVLFHEDFNNKIEKALTKHEPKEWDLLMLYSFMYNIKPQNIKINPYWMKAYNSWSLIAYGMNEDMMRSYIHIQNSHFTIADLVTYRLQEDTRYNIFVTAPSLVIPDLEYGSDIRKLMNYEDNPTAINLGINYTKYNI